MKTDAPIVEIVPYFQDNYAYLLHCDQSRQTAVFDCGDVNSVIGVLQRRNWHLTHIFATHFHTDHTSGISALMERYPQAQFIKPAGEIRLREPSRELNDGEYVHVGNYRIRAIRVPAHTKNCTSYMTEECLFVGDALFSAGCGRLFEGSANDLLAAMDTFLELPDDTKVYAGHEYTKSNLQFALHAEKNNQAAESHYEKVVRMRMRDECTMPSTIGREKRINPFLRIDRESVWRTIDSGDTMNRVQRIAALRRLKDKF